MFVVLEPWRYIWAASITVPGMLLVCVVYIGIGILVLAFIEFPGSFVASDEW